MEKISITFEIPYRIIAKKNSKQVVNNGGRIFVISSKAYREFEETTVQLLGYTVSPKIGATLKPPYTCSYDIYFKGRYEADLDNLIASINDCIEKAGIIENDKYIREYEKPTRFTNMADSFRAVVTLTGFRSTARSSDTERRNDNTTIIAVSK